MAHQHSSEAGTAAADPGGRVRPRYDDINITVLIMVGIISSIVTFLSIVTVQGLAYRMESSFLKGSATLYNMKTAEALRQESIDAQKALLQGGQAPGAAKVPIADAMQRVVDRYSAGRTNMAPVNPEAGSAGAGH